MLQAFNPEFRLQKRLALFGGLSSVAQPSNVSIKQARGAEEGQPQAWIVRGSPNFQACSPEAGFTETLDWPLGSEVLLHRSRWYAISPTSSHFGSDGLFSSLSTSSQCCRKTHSHQGLDGCVQRGAITTRRLHRLPSCIVPAWPGFGGISFGSSASSLRPWVKRRPLISGLACGQPAVLKI